MSSAILYLAIVAIWAVVLVPRWLRHTHTVPQEAESQFTESAAQPSPATAVPAGGAAGQPPAPPETAQPEAAQPEAAQPPGAGNGRLQRPRAGPVSPGADAPVGPTPAERRARILRARRRVLSTLVLLCVGAGGLAVAQLAAWWVAVPPVLILAGFVVLLHEAARIDAERAAARYRAARFEAGVLYEAAVEPDGQPVTGAHPAEPEPAAAYQVTTAGSGADVIDISGRIGDQLYDQYVDAEARAIGD